MPFRSKAQMKACFATDGFGGKVDCKEWARVTNTKSLPNKKEEGGTNMYRPKMQRGGLMWEQQEAERRRQALNQLQQLAPPMTVLERDVIAPPPTPEVPRQQPDRIQEMMKKGLLDIPREEDDMSAQTYLDSVKKKNKPKNPMTAQEVGLLMQSLRTGAGFFAGVKERSRQNQYDWEQQTALGQMNPMPLDDFQPNPFSLYAKYGGNLKTIMKDYNKWTNDAHMDFGSGDEDRGMAQRGGRPVPAPKLDTDKSLVDFMKSKHISSSFETRHYLFDEMFKEPYKGTAKQNEEILKMFKSGKIDPTDVAIDLYGLKQMLNTPPENPEMKKGGYEIDRMLITRKILPELLKLGRLGTSKYRKQTGGVFTTQAEIDAANAMAKGIATRRGLISGEDSYVARNIGDPKPQWQIDPSLAGAPPLKKLPFTVPSNVTRADIQTHNGQAWYTDPSTGDVVDIDFSVLNQPRFRVAEQQVQQDAAIRGNMIAKLRGLKKGGKKR